MAQDLTPKQPETAGPSLRDQNSSFLDQPIHSRLISGYPWPVVMLDNAHVVSSTWVCLMGYTGIPANGHHMIGKMMINRC